MTAAMDFFDLRDVVLVVLVLLLLVPVDLREVRDDTVVDPDEFCRMTPLMT